MQPLSKKSIQKLLVLLPVFLIGGAGLVFALLNFTGSKKNPSSPTGPPKDAFNKTLPSPNLPSVSKNKFEVYLDAARDSLKRSSEWQKDTLIGRLANGGSSPNKGPFNRTATLAPVTSTATGNTTDLNEQRVNDRLKKLYAVMAPADQAVPRASWEMATPGAIGHLPDKSLETDRLEKLLKIAQTPATAHDSTLDRVETVLDKVLQIQHPDRVPLNKPVIANAKPVVYDIRLSSNASSADPADTAAVEEGGNGFYGLSALSDSLPLPTPATIRAVVPETQVLQTGSTIKLRLLQSIVVAGQTIPANSFIYGTCTVNAERLLVQLTNVLSNNQIFPIAARVFDTDGLEGVFVPGAISRDLAKEGAAQGISSMGLTSFDPSIGAQAAAAGIETAKNLLSKKVRAVIVTIKAGHVLLLKNTASLH